MTTPNREPLITKVEQTIKTKLFFWMVKLLKPSYTLLFYYSAVIMCDYWNKQKGKVVTDESVNVFAKILTGQLFKIQETETDGEPPKD